MALAKVIANTAGSSFVQPDTVILHPSNWLTTRLLRDGTGGTAGQFYGGGPFTGAYGNGGAAGMFGQQPWNTRVVLSNYVGAGTALVGNFGQSAHIWRRSGVTVEASNSHSDFYVKNLSMLRAEERLGLGVVPPGRLHGSAGPDLMNLPGPLGKLQHGKGGGDPLSVAPTPSKRKDSAHG